MSARPEWLERYRVKNIFRNRRNKKAVYVDKERNVVDSTHFNLHGGTYSVPINLEQSFLDDYVEFIFSFYMLTTKERRCRSVVEQ